MPNDQKHESIQTRFKDLLQDHRNGGLEYDASLELKKLVEAVRETGKGGSVTIKLSVSPINGDPKKVVMIDEIKSSIPKASVGGSLFFTTEQGGLVQRNPDQLDLRYADEPAKPQ